MRSPMRSLMHFATRACLRVCSPSFGPALESECAPVRARSRSPAPAPPCCHCARAAADVLPSENYHTHTPADARLLPPLRARCSRHLALGEPPHAPARWRRCALLFGTRARWRSVARALPYLRLRAPVRARSRPYLRARSFLRAHPLASAIQ